MSEQGGLNRRIAEALGYRVKPNGKPEWEWLHIAPDGTATICANEAAAWNRHDYANSLDAVAAECKAHCITLKLDFETNYAELVDYPDCVNGTTYRAGANGGSIERAAAECLLAFAEAQRGEGV